MSEPKVRCYDCDGPSGGKVICGPCLLLGQLRDRGIIAMREYRFAKPRRWRADLFIKPDWLLEVDGGMWTGGGHSGGKGQIDDMEKNNAAVMMGFRVLHFTPAQVENGDAVKVVAGAITGE